MENKTNELPWFSMEKVLEKTKDVEGNEKEVAVGKIYIYNRIGKSSFWFGKGDSAEGFAGKLKNLGEIEKLDIYINSPGGSIFEGSAIVSQIDRKKVEGVEVNTHIEGIAASMASIIAMTGEKIYMPEYSLMMIHKPSGGAAGEADDLRKTADLLDKLENKMIGIYKRHTSKTDDEIKELCAKTTWMDAVEAAEMFDNVVIIKNEKVEDAEAASNVVSTLTMMVDDDIEVPDKYKSILTGEVGGELVSKVTEPKEEITVDGALEEAKPEDEVILEEPMNETAADKRIKDLELAIREARIEELERTLAKKEADELEALYKSEAEEFDNLPIATDDLAELIKLLDGKDSKKEYDSFMNLLTSMKNVIAESAILEVMGTDVQTKAEANPEEELDKIINELMEKNENLTYSLAYGKALRMRPDLYSKLNKGDEK